MDLTEAPDADTDDPAGSAREWVQYAVGVGLALSAVKVGNASITPAIEWLFGMLRDYFVSAADTATSESNDETDVF